MAGTSVAETQFCLAKIEYNDQYLWIDGNQKITAGNGDYENPMPNAFSIVQIEDCPFSTPTCRSTCYVHNLGKFANPTHQKYRHNSETIREILSGPTDHYVSWGDVMANWISKNAYGGFRWHVSGDVFSDLYARFIAEVCCRSGDVRHWIYTRSFPYVRLLAKANNLEINLSADKDNYDEAMKLNKKFGWRICYLTIDGSLPEDLPKGSVIFPDYSLRAKDTPLKDHAWWNSLSKAYRKMVCPVDMFGKSTNVRCGVCKKCLRG